MSLVCSLPSNAFYISDIVQRCMANANVRRAAARAPDTDELLGRLLTYGKHDMHATRFHQCLKVAVMP